MIVWIITRGVQVYRLGANHGFTICCKNMKRDHGDAVTCFVDSINKD